jgi:DNA-binding NarL/FixJ family response regulator
LNILRIIIAEDQEFISRALLRLLGNRFDVVAVAKDARALVDAAILLHPDVIISDFLTPKLSGLEALQELMVRRYRIPFVFISSDIELLTRGTWSLVDKRDVASELESAIYAAASGHRYISRSIQRLT